ncbi:MAG: hypothetical protein ACKOPG_06425 [Novosphingobium sp.]
MKKLALIAMTAAAAFAAPAMAQTTTGTINITGSVAAKCMVVSGTGTSSSFGTTVAMGELAQADGTLKPSSTLAATFGSVGGAGLAAHVVCTSPDATVTVDADPLVSPSGAGAPTGYSNTINYSADVTFTKTTGSLALSNDSTAASQSSSALGGRLAASGTNVTVATSNWRTPNTGDLLTSGTDYSGKIVVTISPL